MLVILEVWRHRFRRVPIRYDPQVWSVVFPLGMKAAGTFQLGRAKEARPCNHESSMPRHLPRPSRPCEGWRPTSRLAAEALEPEIATG